MRREAIEESTDKGRASMRTIIIPLFILMSAIVLLVTYATLKEHAAQNLANILARNQIAFKTTFQRLLDKDAEIMRGLLFFYSR
jgi:hypothetical protein